MRTRSTDGFTLVELAIVLAVIGLLVGGVLGGQALIKSTDLKSIAADFSKYRGAYNQFKAQYSGPPGDIPDAQDYWGAQTTTFTCTGSGTAATPGTCNGDGDGTLDIAADYLEIFHAWQQMQLAGFLDGNYAGVPGSTTTAPSSATKYGAAGVMAESTPGTNVPRGKRVNTGYALFYLPTIAAGNTASYTDFYYGDYGTVIIFGTKVTADLPKAAALTPEEAQSIDTKTDDGIAGSGRIFTLATTSSSCVSSQTVSTTTATYAVSNAGTYCVLGMKID